MTTQTRWILAVALIGLFAISTGTIAWAAWSFQSAGMISVEVMEGDRTTSRCRYRPAS